MINTLPEVSPIAAGANLIVNFALCPTASVNGSNGAAISKPLPDTAALVIVNGPPPEFMIVTIWLLLEPTGTPPKLRLVALTPRFPGATHPDWKRATKYTATRIRSL